MGDHSQLSIGDFFGPGLKKRREAAGISIDSMALMLGVSRYTIYNYENGHHKPDIVTGLRMYNLINTALEKKEYPHGKFG